MNSFDFKKLDIVSEDNNNLIKIIDNAIILDRIVLIKKSGFGFNTTLLPIIEKRI